MPKDTLSSGLGKVIELLNYSWIPHTPCSQNSHLPLKYNEHTLKFCSL